MPITIENKPGSISKVTSTTFKTVQVTFEMFAISIGKATIELTIEVEDKAQQQEIYDAIQNWRELSLNS